MPEILFGDPTTFTEIANATKRQHKYTSGVIAFRDGLESQSVTPEQIATLIEAFRSTFMPGLKVDENFADFWVMHRDKGNLELHFLVANTELKTGQQLNIHPPGEKNIEFFNAFSAVMNDNFGFAQVVPDPLKISLKPFEAKSPNGKREKEAKNDFADELHTRIVSGSIANRNQLIGYMKKRGIGIALVGDEFITVRLPGAGRNTRLKGSLFSKDSDYAALVKEHHQSKIPKFLTPAESADQRSKLVDFIAARTAFNTKRYLTPRPGAKRAYAAKKGPSGGNRKDGKTPTKEKVPTTLERDTTEIRSKLEKKLKEIKEHAKEVQLGQQGINHSAPHRVARMQHERENPTNLPNVGSAVGGLEAQIGGLSMQYHNLLLLLAGATGTRATKLQAQIIAIEQKLVALNLELEKRKLKEAKDNELKYK
ncbi:hypothetical protein AR463_01100 [Ralstonia solanacearum]|nr:hypothetical protein AR463_01100 [Ralstonia solanacearum]OCQ64471.1 hypothetical protein AR464_15840 [Ralstonia solanacearum]OCQ64621.1 hypothetical protein AR465_11220 [Ralstonia solanacearum]OCQ74301.1 hypothetical protein AR466_14850 [Ralstonia solanacearum]